MVSPLASWTGRQRRSAAPHHIPGRSLLAEDPWLWKSHSMQQAIAQILVAGQCLNHRGIVGKKHYRDGQATIDMSTSLDTESKHKRLALCQMN